jgi:hypothetical protein
LLAVLLKLGSDDLRFRSCRDTDIASDDLRNCCWFVTRIVTNGDLVNVAGSLAASMVLKLSTLVINSWMAVIFGAIEAKTDP